MKFTILSPQDKKEYAIAWLEINTTSGNMVIQPQHAPMIVTIPPEKSMTLCLQNGKQETIKTAAGILEIQRTAILFLANE